MIAVMDDTIQLDPGGPGDQGRGPRPPRWSGRARRILVTSAIGTVLLGTGAAIGVAVTGGASAATGSTSPTPATSAITVAGATNHAGAPSASPRSRCATIVEQALNSNHSRLATRLHAFCTRPLLRLALVGGEHGQVTFRGKSGPTTVAFERGTVTAATGSAITVGAADGTTWTWHVTSATVVRQAGSQTTTGAITTGRQVFVGGTVVGGAYDARLVRIRGGG